MSFKRGDTVELKSGGPYMTVSYVEEVEGEDYVIVSCTWFAENKASNEKFTAEMLKQVDLS